MRDKSWKAEYFREGEVDLKCRILKWSREDLLEVWTVHLNCSIETTMVLGIRAHELRMWPEDSSAPPCNLKWLFVYLVLWPQMTILCFNTVQKKACWKECVVRKIWQSAPRQTHFLKCTQHGATVSSTFPILNFFWRGPGQGPLSLKSTSVLSLNASALADSPAACRSRGRKSSTWSWRRGSWRCASRSCSLRGRKPTFIRQSIEGWFREKRRGRQT